MDSSFYNHSYGQWHGPLSPRPHPASFVASPHPPSFPANPNFYARSSSTGDSHQHYSHRHEHPLPPPPPTVNQPPPYCSTQLLPPPPPPQQLLRYNTQQLTYESHRMSSQPSLSSSCTESRVLSHSAWVGRKDTRSDSWKAVADSCPGRNYQFDYSRLSRGSSDDSTSHGLDRNSRFRGKLRSLAYAREEFGVAKIERNYQDRGQLKPESGRSSRVLGAGNRGLPSSFGYGNDRYGALEDRPMIRSSAGNGGSGNQRWFVDGKVSNGGRNGFSQKKEDYYHSEIERYCNNGSRGSSNESNRTPKKSIQKKSVLLRIETPRSNMKGRENERSRHLSYYNENRSNSFRGKDHLGHFDRELVHKQRERTPVELDVSFKSNVLVAKAVDSPTTAGVTSGVSLTPRPSKVRRVLMTDSDTDEKASLTDGIVKVDVKTHVTNEVSGSEGFKQPERQVAAPEKEYDSHSSSSSIVSKDKFSADKLLEVILSDCKVTPIDTDHEASVDNAAAIVCCSARSAEKVSCSDEASERSKDEVDAEYDSNLKLYSAGQNIFDGDKCVMKSFEDVLDRKDTSCSTREIFLSKIMKKKTIIKNVMERGSTSSMSYVSQPTLTNTEKSPSKYFEGEVPFPGMSLRSTEPQPCNYEVLKYSEKGVLSDFLMNETDVEFEGRKSLSSSLGALCYGEKELDESFTESAMPSNCKIAADKLLPESLVQKSSAIKYGSEVNTRKRDSLSSDNDFSRDCTEDLNSSAGNVKCGTSPSEMNNVFGAVGNADSFTLEANINSSNDLPKRSFVFQTGNETFENGVSQPVEGRPSKKDEETTGNLGRDTCKQTGVNEIASSRGSIGGNGSFDALPVGRDDYPPGVGKNREGLSDNLYSSRAISSEICVEYASFHNIVPNQDADLGSQNPAEYPFSDQFSVLDCTGQTACFTEPNISLVKDTIVQSEFSLEREVRDCMPRTCGEVPGSPAFVIDNNLVNGNIDESAKETISGPEFCPPEVQPCSRAGTILLENHLECRPSDAAGSLCDSSVGNDLIKDSSMVSSRLIHDCTATLHRLSPPVPVNEQIQNQASAHANCHKCQDGITVKESSTLENLVVDTQEEKMKLSGKASKCVTLGTNTQDENIEQVQTKSSVAGAVYKTSNTKESEKIKTFSNALQEQIMTFHETIQSGSSMDHYPCSGQTSRGTDVESNEPLVSNYPSVCSTETMNGDPMVNMPDVLSDVGSQDNSLTIANADILEAEAPPFDGKVSASDNLGNSDAPPSESLSHVVKGVSGDAKDHLLSVTAPNSKNKVLELSSMSERTHKKESTFNYSVPKSGSRLPFVVTGKRIVKPPNCSTKTNTWHRKSDTSASPSPAVKPLSSAFSTQQKLPKVTVQMNSSYIRKGNSLVRKPSHGTPGGISLGFPPSSLQVNRMVVDEDNSMRSVGRADAGDTSMLVKAGENFSPERQSILLSENISKISNSITTSSGKGTLSSGIDPDGLPESIMDSAASGEADVPHSGEGGLKASVSLNQTAIASNCQKKGDPANMPSANPRKILYFKRKSNQLVAALDVHNASNSLIPPTDGYFKRSKNQLVRTSDSHVKQAVRTPDDALDSQVQAAAKMIPKRNFSSAFLDFAAAKRLKCSKFSLVWSLNGTQSGKTNRGHMHCQKILPQLVPWKRVTYWRRLMNSAPVSRNSSLPTISRKLLLLRKRHTLYTRSTNGFSLRKSKVLSIGGSHLKWSKSIERNSKKANEEATLAVAEFAKKKGENCSGKDIIGTKSTDHLPRERIFRIGSIRYKMDPSGRTLHRISDVKSPCSGATEFGNDVKKSFIPKRLVIGNDEYVRVGNGNQLVRDPKKRTRVLANEKVRWSLYNVRLRLARKKKYCQFFTRFGKCNKSNGKCPYIHDQSKIAVCTKFLNGLCTNPNCKLTHKVIPERMPDCSYFLQGLCNNKVCPYRHVHVNRNAPICEGFLRGYCSDGNECQKKHTNTCPVFEAMGSCPQGSKCKLHHPKNRSRGRKRKRASEPSHKNARGRYFGSLLDCLPQSEPMLLDRCAANNAVFGGEASDYIKLNVSEDEGEESNDQLVQRSMSSDSDARDLLYELIRPVRLMQK